MKVERNSSPNGANMISFDMTPRFKEKAIIRKFSKFRNGKLMFESSSSLILIFQQYRQPYIPVWSKHGRR
jgi:hypothetical protein